MARPRLDRPVELAFCHPWPICRSLPLQIGLFRPEGRDARRSPAASQARTAAETFRPDLSITPAPAAVHPPSFPHLVHLSTASTTSPSVSERASTSSATGSWSVATTASTTVRRCSPRVFAKAPGRGSSWSHSPIASCRARHLPPRRRLQHTLRAGCSPILRSRNGAHRALNHSHLPARRAPTRWEPQRGSPP